MSPAFIHGLTQHFASPQRTPNETLEVAVREGRISAIREAVLGGAELNPPAQSNSMGLMYASRTVWPLHLAARLGVPEVVNALLELKADPNAKNSLGFTPIQIAATAGHLHLKKIWERANLTPVAVCTLRPSARPMIEQPLSPKEQPLTLFQAVEQEDLLAVQAALKGKVDFTVRNLRNMTVFDVVKEQSGIFFNQLCNAREQQNEERMRVLAEKIENNQLIKTLLDEAQLKAKTREIERMQDWVVIDKEF